MQRRYYENQVVAWAMAAMNSYKEPDTIKMQL